MMYVHCVFSLKRPDLQAIVESGYSYAAQKTALKEMNEALRPMRLMQNKMDYSLRCADISGATIRGQNGENTNVTACQN